MKISVFGLGYVGAVSCACFARMGHNVIGVDVSDLKIKLINSGKSPIVEKDLDEYIEDGITKGNITATNNVESAVHNSDISIVCVGTPSQINGNIDLTYIYRVCNEIGEAIKTKKGFHTVVIRSTVVPGTIKQCAQIIEDVSGKKHGQDFGVASNPEFLRESTAIEDFWNPPYTVIGTLCEQSEKQLIELYSNIDAPIFALKPEESEMIKYANNNFHAVKVTFANEVGNICKELGVDGQKVMEVVASDKKLNLSSYYMKPGFAFGGSCLPKDVRGLNYRAKTLDLKTPLLSSLMNSNNYQVERGLQLIYKTGKRKIGFLGFAFKGGTDDLRESPIVEIIETLLGKGYDLSLYDSNILLSRLMGKNKDYLTGHIPHINRVLKDSAEDVIKESDIIVFGNKSEEFKQILNNMPKDKIVIDLVRIDKSRTTKDNYVGICW
ncbi:nucleotide sugar dehydrogenase [Catalinimonas niigatensis]|uniref:nucleotide sugar dehydrogenase n=1 Tax=Catalinimonas niigatensis TaxID=1397264 RepID=UPI002666EB32|nr:UDP-glucose/GDP-mannose dehydrogenase family protein [Catalinimonas niigatensis]WPP50561.1 UDP-glucose/GDP-mannose dehydrogenase family protein [Catalinimonas niigatensis]